MNIVEEDFAVAHQHFTITNQKVLYWKNQEALLLSDLHVGKAAHFRKHGIAMPHGIFQQDLRRLDALVMHYQPKQIYIIGDLLHAGDNSEVQAFCHWRKKTAHVRLHLVRGNHDRLTEKLVQDFALESCELEYDFDDFIFRHEPEKNSKKFQFCGHVHPGMVLRTAVKKYRLPAYVCTDQHFILPAFSDFTGLDTANTPRRGKFWLPTAGMIHFLER